MDRRLATKNIRSGLIAATVALFMFGASFLAAVIYVS